MNPLPTICSECKISFEFSEEELGFLSQVSPQFGGEKFAIPMPQLCKDCRRQTRLAWRNERKLYYRTCDFSGKSIVSMFSADKPYKIYREQDWWSDKWNPLDYGRDFDFSRPFFEQFAELLRSVPMLSRNILLCENSDFVNGAANCKNCYLSFTLDYCEDSFYVTNAKHCRSCVDCYSVKNCELCYEGIDLENCYKTYFSTRSINCSDSAFLADCLRCTNCIGCVGLVGQEYCIFNQKVTPEAFLEFKKNLSSHTFLDDFKKKFDAFALAYPKKYYFGNSNEEFSGDNIQNIKNSFNCFESNELENCRNCYYVFQAKNCMDYDIFGDNSEWIYNCIAVGLNSSNNLFCYGAWNGSGQNLYCMFIGGSSNNFGCVGIKRSSYCIFNKQYSKEDYEVLVARILEHMRQTGEWGEFFPMRMSPFAYNESVAADQFPLDKAALLERGLKYKEEDSQSNYVGPSLEAPDTIEATTNDVTNGIFQCEVSGKPYKVIPNEIQFYRDTGLPLPHRSPEQRHLDRMARRNPRKLWERACGQCAAPIQTTYSPDRPEKVLCEACYLTTVY